MEKFNFRLQSLLDIRCNKEEESKIAFKEAQSAKDLTETRLENLKENYDKYSKIDFDCSSIDRKIRQNYCNVLQFNINETSIELDKRNEILEGKRQELKQRQMERKTVEILKDKQEAAYIKEQNLIEQKANDEFALYAYIRNSKI
ncbi:flagellar export protein FliJ [Clostridium botulinum]|uniref:Flagellar FliJ protein n=1 Tax=Clostridium botulinum TaxID=1491 RepID=A0A9Q1V121_CLOBO|nr:flagellar export protein FliJ [Clostridium botulinum]AEB75813.1 flagellar protein fliJ [Clostridium botulinum BKT015925]KEH98603.1 flagellar biosynthesis protein FliJ [Clostridium botulinum D str. 16868]KEI05733.1 flagellar biosynthesis protein FliJ [Clostridium botulinum C/D str. Sp77]KLU75644.1 flagellar biosynthesis protein FliJ [Clostridium botulinum V891]KOA75283.1 flagellar biosynthesis protein FliJ [Clostridium botulinum]